MVQCVESLRFHQPLVVQCVESLRFHQPLVVQCLARSSLRFYQQPVQPQRVARTRSRLSVPGTTQLCMGPFGRLHLGGRMGRNMKTTIWEDRSGNDPTREGVVPPIRRIELLSPFCGRWYP